MNSPPQPRGVESARAPYRDRTNPYQRILVVDDDEFVRQISVGALLGHGYHVDTAENGVEGWEALQVGNFDLLVTDHSMPKMSGIELVKKVRIARIELPAILVSGELPTEELVRHPWLKFSAILAKPFSTEELLGTVKEALSAPGDESNHTGASAPFPTADQRRSMQPRRWGINE